MYGVKHKQLYKSLYYKKKNPLHTRKAILKNRVKTKFKIKTKIKLQLKFKLLKLRKRIYSGILNKGYSDPTVVRAKVLLVKRADFYGLILTGGQ
jgi:hypothetical protein